MRKRDFYGLPRSLQDRFVESSQGVSVPKPLLVAAEKDWVSAGWWAVALGLTILWVLYIRLGFGDVTSALALGGWPQLVGHVLLGAGASYCALRGYRYSWESSRRPYGSGLFLFPAGVVRARGSELIEFFAGDLTAQLEGSSVSLRSGGQIFAFDAGAADYAKQVLQTFQEGKEKWQSLAEGEDLERARLSPLVESGVPNPLAPIDRHPRPRLISSPVVLLIAAVVGLSVGYTVHFFRTKLSEEALYRAATEQNSVGSLKAYLARGGKRPEVADLLLPRAELAVARSSKSVGAILAFRDSHKESPISGEVQSALREALLTELELAKKQGTLMALDALAQRHKDSTLIAGEIAHARRNVIETALARLEAEINPETEGLLVFLRRLLAYSEQHGPKVALRIRHEFSQDPRELDGLVMKAKKYYLGQKQLPTQYFLGEPARSREKALLEAIRERLQRAVQPDVLTFEAAEVPPGPNVELPAPTGPTLTIEHRERLSGGFIGGMPRGMYMGAAVYIVTTFSLPEGEPLEHKLTQWRPPRFSIPGEEPTMIPQVYEDMMGGAFDKYRERYLGFWFKSP